MNTVNEIAVNTPATVKVMAKVIRAAGVMPELEIFDTGDLNLAKDLIKDGTLEGPGLYTFVMGVKYALNSDPETLMYMRNQLPVGAKWAAFGISRAAFPIVAQALLLGGGIRVGLEDNIYMEKGVLCESNAQQVERAKRIVHDLGGELASSNEARQILNLNK
jgi:uncharacterized protein (DUF849 family)